MPPVFTILSLLLVCASLVHAAGTVEPPKLVMEMQPADFVLRPVSAGFMRLHQDQHNRINAVVTKSTLELFQPTAVQIEAYLVPNRYWTTAKRLAMRVAYRDTYLRQQAPDLLVTWPNRLNLKDALEKLHAVPVPCVRAEQVHLLQHSTELAASTRVQLTLCAGGPVAFDQQWHRHGYQIVIAASARSFFRERYALMTSTIRFAAVIPRRNLESFPSRFLVPGIVPRRSKAPKNLLPEMDIVRHEGSACVTCSKLLSLKNAVYDQSLGCLLHRECVAQARADFGGGDDEETVSDRVVPMSEECAICMDALALQDADTVRQCGHGFHRWCLLKWSQAKRHKDTLATCPSCRGVLYKAVSDQ